MNKIKPIPMHPKCGQIGDFRFRADQATEEDIEKVHRVLAENKATFGYRPEVRGSVADSKIEDIAIQIVRSIFRD